MAGGETAGAATEYTEHVRGVSICRHELAIRIVDALEHMRLKHSMISFTVYGKPIPQGSMKAFIPKGWKRPVLTSDNAKLKSYRQEVTLAGMKHARENRIEIIKRPHGVSLCATLFFERPKSRKKAVEHTVKPDVDKCARAIFDSLTGVFFEDDSQVCAVVVNKRYGTPERTEIRLAEKTYCFGVRSRATGRTGKNEK